MCVILKPNILMARIQKNKAYETKFFSFLLYMAVGTNELLMSSSSFICVCVIVCVCMYAWGVWWAPLALTGTPHSARSLWLSLLQRKGRVIPGGDTTPSVPPREPQHQTMACWIGHFFHTSIFFHSYTYGSRRHTTEWGERQKTKTF